MKEAANRPERMRKGAPSPFTTFPLFYDGQFVTHEILSEKKSDKILTDKVQLINVNRKMKNIFS